MAEREFILGGRNSNIKLEAENVTKLVKLWIVQPEIHPKMIVAGGSEIKDMDTNNTIHKPVYGETKNRRDYSFIKMLLLFFLFYKPLYKSNLLIIHSRI